MEETLVTVETARLAFEKGFNLACRYAYDEIEDILNSAVFHNGNEFFEFEDIQNAIENTGSKHYLVPSQSILQKWLREVHKINVESCYLPNAEKYASHAVPMNIIKPKHYNSVGECYNARKKYLSKNRFNTYEEALEEGLINGLNQL